MKEIVYFILGATVGAALVLLFAPESGKELRATIQSAAGQGRTKLQAGQQAAMAKTHERLDQTKADLKQTRQPAPVDAEDAA